MTIEAAQTINELNTSFPRSTDLLREGDDHIRMIKATLQRTFPRIQGTVSITSTTLNNLATFLTTTPNSMTVDGDLRSTGSLIAGNRQPNNVGTLRLFTHTDREANFSIPINQSDMVAINHTPNVVKFNFGGMNVENVNNLYVEASSLLKGEVNSYSAFVTRLQNDPANPQGGQYLNTPEIRSGFRGRGSYNLPNGQVGAPYGYFSLYAQEHVGSTFSGILQLNGFSAAPAWHFHQSGELETPNLNVNGYTNLRGNTAINGNIISNLRVIWGGNGHSYQENGDIVRVAGGNSIFPSFGGSNGTLSGALTWARDNINNNINNINDRVNNVRTVNRRGVTQGDVGAFICGVGDFGANDGYGWACDMQIWKNNVGGWVGIAWN